MLRLRGLFVFAGTEEEDQQWCNGPWAHHPSIELRGESATQGLLQFLLQIQLSVLHSALRLWRGDQSIWSFSGWTFVLDEKQISFKCLLAARVETASWGYRTELRHLNNLCGKTKEKYRIKCGLWVPTAPVLQRGRWAPYGSSFMRLMVATNLRKKLMCCSRMAFQPISMKTQKVC